jgi:NitT/TauT family transport system substrate-binding protein
VVPLLVIYQHTPFVLFAREGGSIKRLEDIAGKRVGVAYRDSDLSTYRQMLAAAGIDGKSITEVSVGTDMSRFFNGEVDVWPGYAINEPILAEEKNVPVHVFRPQEWGIELYADTLFTTGAQIKQKPDIVKKFVQATHEGWNYAILHREEAADITMKYASETTRTHQLAMMEASLKSLGSPGDQFGKQTLEGWESSQKILLEGHFLERPLPLSAMLQRLNTDVDPKQGALMPKIAFDKVS